MYKNDFMSILYFYEKMFQWLDDIRQMGKTNNEAQTFYLKTSIWLSNRSQLFLIAENLNFIFLTFNDKLNAQELKIKKKGRDWLDVFSPNILVVVQDVVKIRGRTPYFEGFLSTNFWQKFSWMGAGGSGFYTPPPNSSYVNPWFQRSGVSAFRLWRWMRPKFFFQWDLSFFSSTKGH